MTLSKMLFGELALKKGLVTQEQIDECLVIQKKLKEMGITKTLGAVMHDKKYLSMVEIKEILREMTGTKDWNAIEGYHIHEKLGKGGMGSVYKALHTGLNKFVALKVLPPDLANDQEYLDRFWREARAAAQLNHPNIVQALDVGESFGYHYFVMEYVDGVTVKDLIDREGSIEEAKALHLAAQVCEALICAFRGEIIHRDIKPSNIIVSHRGVAKLCDLGLAKSVNEDSAITQTGVIMGTPFYLSPEQARNEELDCRSDLYSLGVTLFHMVCGRVPFTGNTAATILYKHIFMEAPKARSIKPGLSEATERVIDSMLQKDPDARPRDALELRETLCAALAALAPELVGADGRLIPLPQPEEPEPEEPPAEAARSTGSASSSAEVSAALTQDSIDAASVETRAEPASALETSQGTTAGLTELEDGSRPAISGPVARVGASPGDTHATTGSLTGGITVGLEEVLPKETVRKRSRLRPALIAASVVGILACGALALREVQALIRVPPPVITNIASLLGGTISPALAPHYRAAEAALRRRDYGGAAEAFAALRKAPRNAAEEARLLALESQAVKEAVRAVDQLYAQYTALSKQRSAGRQATEVLARIERMRVPRLAEHLAEVERQLRAETGR